jgi:transcription antitermination factor NusG
LLCQRFNLEFTIVVKDFRNGTSIGGSLPYLASIKFMEARFDDAITSEWFAVQVWSGREHVSAAHLRVRGYEVFLPCYRERRRWSDRIKVVDRALFSGYVFCRLAERVVAKIVSAPGVIRIVGDQQGPLPIPEHEIEAIQRIVQSPFCAEPWSVPCVGQKVRIETGPLRGIEGVISVLKNRRRLVVSISLLQRAVAVEIDSQSISIPYAMFGPAAQRRPPATRNGA